MSEIRDAYARVIHDAKEGLIHDHERDAMINALVTTHPNYHIVHQDAEGIWPERWDRRAAERKMVQDPETSLLGRYAGEPYGSLTPQEDGYYDKDQQDASD